MATVNGVSANTEVQLPLCADSLSLERTSAGGTNRKFFKEQARRDVLAFSLSPGSANLKLQRLTAAPSQSGSYTKKLPVLTDMHASYIPPLREHPVEADTPSRRQMDLLNDVEGRVPCSRCMLLSGRDKDGTAVIFWPQTEARSSTQLGGYQSPCATLVHPP